MSMKSQKQKKTWTVIKMFKDLPKRSTTFCLCSALENLHNIHFCQDS